MGLAVVGAPHQPLGAERAGKPSYEPAGGALSRGGGIDDVGRDLEVQVLEAGQLQQGLRTGDLAEPAMIQRHGHVTEASEHQR